MSLLMSVLMSYCHHSLIRKISICTTACQITDAHVTLQGRTMQVQNIYHKEDIIAVRCDQRMEVLPFWLKVLLEDIEVHDGNLLRQKVVHQWLNQTGSTYIQSQWCLNGNLPKFILTWVVGYTGKGSNITITSKDNTRLCRESQWKNSRGWDSIWRGGDWSVAFKITGVCLSGQRTTRFLLR